MSVLLVAVSLSGVLFFPRPAGAFDLVASVANEFIDGVTTLAFVFARVCIGLTVAALEIFMEIAAYNGYIDAPPVIVGWYMVRDVANMFFVVALLVIAFGTILGLEQYEWKKSLVKLVLAAILINFSRLIIGIVIDASHVFTMTFLNAVQATAAGNLINMLKLDKILAITGSNDALLEDNVRWGILAAGLAGALFAVVALVAVGAYLIVMTIRVVILWVLIILSPLAFMLSTIPQGKQYADEFWSELMKYIIVAPITVFFLWLAFATLGNGDINNVVGVPTGLTTSADAQQILTIGGQQSATLSEITQWDNISAFFIAIVFLFVGLERVQRVGTAGGSFVSGAVQFGKNALTIASGYAAGRFAVGAAARGSKALAKGAAYYAPVIGGEKIERFAKRQWKGLQAWYYDTGYSPKVKRNADGSVKLNEKGQAEFELDENGQLILELQDRGMVQRAAHWFAARDIESKKKLEKTEKFADNRKELLDKRTTGVPTYWLQKDHEMADALDRVEVGMVEGEKARSAAKTKEFGGKGKFAVIRDFRFKDGEITAQDKNTGEPLTIRDVNERVRAGTLKLEDVVDAKGRPALTMGSFLAQHELEGEAAEARAKIELEDRRRGLIDEGKKEAETVQAKIDTLKTSLMTDKEKKLTTDLAQAEQTLQAEDEKIRKKYETEQTEKLEGSDNAPVQVIRKAQEELAKEIGKDAIDAIVEYSENWGEAQKLQKTVDGHKQLAEEARTAGDDKLAARHEAAATALEKQITERRDRNQEIANTTDDFAAKKTAYEENQKRIEEEKKKIKAIQDDIGKKQKKELDAAEESTGVKTLRDEQSKYLKSDEYKQEKSTKEYKEKEEHVKEEIEELGRGLKTKAGRWYAAKMSAHLSDQELKQSEAELEAVGAKLDYFNEMLEHTAMAKLGEEAAKKFLETIEEGHLIDLFEKGADELRKVLSNNQLKVDPKSLSAAARAVQQTVVADYTKDLAGVKRTEAADVAESMYTREKYGLDTPASAFKAWTKKRMDQFQGVEREQAVKMIVDSFKKILHKKSQGKTLGSDERAQLMAGLKYVTTQAWSDDVLARMVNVIRENAQGKYSGEDKAQADELKRIFIDELGWGKDEAGQIDIVNKSSGQRTNDLHRLMAFAGDEKLLFAENAVLAHQENQGKQGRELGYVDAVEDLAGKVKGLKDAGKSFEEIATTLGMTGARAVREVEHFFQEFVNKTKTTVGARDAFVDRVKNHGDELEMLTDFKNLAIATTHLDDGGHAYYDMQGGFARGFTYKQAMGFLLSDWRKVDANRRMNSLKIHAVAHMDEDFGTASRFDPDSWATTFAGILSQLQIEKMDVRNQRLILKNGAEDDFRHDTDGSLVIGGKGSTIQDKTYGRFGDKSEEAAKKDVARDFAVAMQKAPQILMALLAKNSGVGFQDAMNGTMKLTLFGEKIKSLEQFLQWVDTHRGSRVQYERDSKKYFRDEDRDYEKLNYAAIRNRLQAAAQGSGKKKGGGGSPGPLETPDEE